MPQVIGPEWNPDGPGNSGDAYLNRKKVAALNTSATCDANMLFTDVFAGWTGRAHDSTVLQASPLYCGIRDGALGETMQSASIEVEGQTVSVTQIRCDLFSHPFPHRFRCK